MDVRHPPDTVRCRTMTTAELREAFLVDAIFTPGAIPMVYSHVDRAIVGSAVPLDRPLSLEAGKEMAARYFAERREIGVINIGQPGKVVVDGKEFPLGERDFLYVGRGSREVAFHSDTAGSPAKFYFVSYPAHRAFPTRSVSIKEADAVTLGSDGEANRRTIYKVIRPDGVESCQLVMGMTTLAEGSVWNTMAAHTHERRSEIYLYFDLPADAVVFHLMGQPAETRHVVVRNQQAILSPSWSIHSGVGTRAYTFVWSMGGENQEFSDMDGVAMNEIA